MKDSSQPSKRRRYEAAFRAEALRLAGEGPWLIQDFHKALKTGLGAEKLQLPYLLRHIGQRATSCSFR